MQPAQDQIDLFVEILSRPPEERLGEEMRFVRTFANEWLRKRKILNEFPELSEAWERWQIEKKRNRAAETPEPEQDESAAPPRSVGDGRAATAEGKILGALAGTSREPTDEEVGEFLERQERKSGRKAVGCASLLARGALGFALAAGVGMGGCFAWRVGQEAWRTGEKVHDGKQGDGKFADDIAINPIKAKLPGQKDDDQKEEKKERGR